MKKLIALISFVVLAFTSTACSLRRDPAPSVTPSAYPSVSVSVSTAPSVEPSTLPSVMPTVVPSVMPSAVPSVAPSIEPSVIPSVQPSVVPSVEPSVAPSVIPSVEPSVAPSVIPSVAPSVTPSVIPSVTPSVPEEPVGPTDAELLSAVTFSNSTKTYNGSEYKLEVKNLPEKAQVVYAVNPATTGADNVAEYDVVLGARKPGVYGVTATVTLGDASRELSAVLTVKKARLTIKANNVQKELYAPHPEFTYKVSGLKGDDVFYFGLENPNEGVEGGENRATFTGNLVLSTEVDRYSETGGEITITEYPESDCYNVTVQEGTLSIAPLITNLLKGTAGGLKMNGNYEMTYNGKVVSWQGVNYFGLLRTCYDLGQGVVTEDRIQNVFRGLEDLAAYNVKAIRFSTTFFYDYEWKNCFMRYDEATGTYVVDEEKEKQYIYTLKRLYNKAASLNIGLIPSVFWTMGHHTLFPGETESDAIANENAKSYQFGVYMQNLLLEHFNDHPALFMWEYGNEWNLAVDHADISSDTLIKGRSAWAKQIAAANVGYNRVIASGDATLRAAQYHLRHENSWNEDTMQQYGQVMQELNAGITSVSTHIYPNLPLVQYITMQQAGVSSSEQKEEIAKNIRKQYYENPQAVIEEMKQVGLFDANGFFTGKLDSYSSKLSDMDTMEEQFRMVVENAKNMKATCYVGEYGLNPDASYLTETALQHSKYYNSTLSNGMVINGEDYNQGLSHTLAEEEGVYVHGTYEDILQFSQATAIAQKNAGMPLLLYWNYEYNANIDRLNDSIKRSLGGKPAGWTDYSTGSPYSMSVQHHAKARIILSVVKEVNDAWDKANA
ncbi:MAG: hypothetical protein IKC56_05100 [Clostridia bacterium]|nr:hypothetical protein [Clostridia bacterium]